MLYVQVELLLYNLKIHEHAKDNLVDDCEICQTYSVIIRYIDINF